MSKSTKRAALKFVRDEVLDADVLCASEDEARALVCALSSALLSAAFVQPTTVHVRSDGASAPRVLDLVREHAPTGQVMRRERSEYERFASGIRGQTSPPVVRAIVAEAERFARHGRLRAGQVDALCTLANERLKGIEQKRATGARARAKSVGRRTP